MTLEKWEREDENRKEHQDWGRILAGCFLLIVMVVFAGQSLVNRIKVSDMRSTLCGGITDPLMSGRCKKAVGREYRSCSGDSLNKREKTACVKQAMRRDGWKWSK